MNRLAVSVLALFFTAAPAVAQTPTMPPSVIVTQGEAVVRRAPDRAWLTVAAETRSSRAEDARTQNAEAMTAVQEALAKAGLPKDALRTTGFAVRPEFDYNDGRSILRGYVVRNQIDVRIDDLEQLSAVVDAVNAPKHVAISVHGPRFDLKDEAAARNEALTAAVTDALGRARAIAAGAKRTMGNVIRVDEAGTEPMPPPQPVMMRMSAAEDASTPITPGEIEVRARVTVTVALE